MIALDVYVCSELHRLHSGPVRPATQHHLAWQAHQATCGATLWQVVLAWWGTRLVRLGERLQAGAPRVSQPSLELPRRRGSLPR